MIGLMDCNNFFVSCERLFRPDLRGKPVAVLSSNDGCIVARSQEVKDLGIPMGVPLFQVKDIVKKNNITLFSSNFPLYRDISSRVMYALREEFEEISVYSIDEAFFDLEKGQSILDIQGIRERIIKKTGIPVSFGLAPTKTIAKLANVEAKKGNGVVLLTIEDALNRYECVSCGAVWGVGRQMTKRLDVLGIRTVSAMLKKGLYFMRQEFGVQGERIFLELTGVRAEGGSHDLPANASIMSTRSFSGTHTDKAVIMSALGHHIAHVSLKLRERGLKARSLTIICAPSRHGDFALRRGGRSIDLEIPTNDTTVLLKSAHDLLGTFFESEVPYKKAGVIVSGLIPDAYVANSLFESSQNAKEKRTVDDVVDAINERFGRDTVRSGVILNTSTWAANSRLRSYEYTTNWGDIAKVKAI
jgi:DNA polymerase V